MELPGFLKVLILIFALLVPISIVYLVYRTLFSGLNSISSSKKTDPKTNNSENSEQSQSHPQSEKATNG